MNTKLKLILFPISVFLLFSCRQPKQNQIERTPDSVNAKWRGKKISLPQSLEKIDSNNQNSVSENSEYSIIAYYDGNCNKCYAELKKWPKIIDEFKNENLNVNLKYILAGFNKALLKSYLEQANIPLQDFYYDYNDSVLLKYSFLTDPGYIHSAMLLNSNDEIVFIGNPTISKEDKRRYHKLMTSDN